MSLKNIKKDDLYFTYASPINSSFVYQKLGLNIHSDIFFIKDGPEECFYVPTFEIDYLKKYSKFSDIRDINEVPEFADNYFMAIINFLKAKKKVVKVPALLPTWLFIKMTEAGLDVRVEDFYFFKPLLYKKPEEIKLIKKTAKGVKACFKEIELILNTAKTKNNQLFYQGNLLSSELLLSLIKEFLLKRNISSELAVVSGGKYSFFPHCQIKHKLLPGEPIIIDLGARDLANGYYVDVSRTYCVGQPKYPEFVKLYQVVLGAKKKLENGAYPGKSIASAYQASAEVLIKNGVNISKLQADLNNHFVCQHSLGHGVGRDLHQLPVIGKNTPVNFEKNMVLAFEPGAYNKKLGGIRLEDTYLITANGSENLTKGKYNFLILKK